MELVSGPLKLSCGAQPLIFGTILAHLDSTIFAVAELRYLMAKSEATAYTQLHKVEPLFLGDFHLTEVEVRLAFNTHVSVFKDVVRFMKVAAVHTFK